jgi:hypothetical protein
MRRLQSLGVLTDWVIDAQTVAALRDSAALHAEDVV